MELQVFHRLVSGLALRGSTSAYVPSRAPLQAPSGPAHVRTSDRQMIMAFDSGFQDLSGNSDLVANPMSSFRLPSLAFLHQHHSGIKEASISDLNHGTHSQIDSRAMKSVYHDLVQNRVRSNSNPLQIQFKSILEMAQKIQSLGTCDRVRTLCHVTALDSVSTVCWKY